MKFLHTSDWHVGKPLRDRPRWDEYEAVLQQVLDIARQERVDCLLVAGDIYDSHVPPPEAERLVFDFLRELLDTGIPAVIAAGNHDHPKRFAAPSRILEACRIHIRGDPLTPERGGVLEIPSRDGRETACVAVLPWVHERRVLELDALVDPAQPGRPFQQYAERVANMAGHLAAAFRASAINVFLGHLMIDGAVVSPGGGERLLHLGQVYAVAPQRLPQSASYIALGHLHRPQSIAAAAETRYAGSLLQLDFGERGQEKSVFLVDVHPGRPPRVEPVPITAGRRLRDVESALADLPHLAPQVGDDHLRVMVHLDHPVPNLAEQVREFLPNAVAVEAKYRQPRPVEESRELGRLTPEERLQRYYREVHGGELPQPLLALFRQLQGEVQGAAP